MEPIEEQAAEEDDMDWDDWDNYDNSISESHSN